MKSMAVARQVPGCQSKGYALSGTGEKVSMIVLVDTDILIDVALDRRKHADTASALLDTPERRPGTGFVAWHSLSNFYHLVSPTRGRSGARQFVAELVEFIKVAPTTTISMRLAARRPRSVRWRPAPRH